MNAVETEKDVYGTNDSLKGQMIMVEFVSANPTGPMHMGNARGGVLGDTLATVLAACGADVTREFYVNDAGTPDRQVCPLHRGPLPPAHQWARTAIAFPEDGYQGEDIKELAQAYYDQHGDKPAECLRAGAAGRAGAVRPFCEPAPHEDGSGAL